MNFRGKKTIGLVGAGYWGKNLARVFNELGVLKMICDSNSAILAERKKEYPRLLFTKQFSNILEDPDINGVVIATPAATHYALAREVIKAGKDVFVEKPLALNIKEGKELVALAKKEKQVLMVGHLLLYHPAILALKKLVTDKHFGEIHHIVSHRLNLGKMRKEENVLWSFAPHDIAVIIDLMGMPKRVSATGRAYLQKDIADMTLSTFEFGRGKAAHIFVSWLNPFKEQRLSLIGSKTMAVFDDRAEHKLIHYPYTINRKENGDIEALKEEAQIVPIATEEPLKNEVEHFLMCIKKRVSPRTDGEEALNVLKVLHACQRSLERGGKMQNI